MKKTKAIILLCAVIFGLAITSCKPKQSCPAYGSRHKGLSTHRSI